jgi:hypothetical protein
MRLDELAELVGDPVLIARNDSGVRDRQPERLAEQSDHRIPVGEPANGRCLRERGNKTEGRVQMR